MRPPLARYGAGVAGVLAVGAILTASDSETASEESDSAGAPNRTKSEWFIHRLVIATIMQRSPGSQTSLGSFTAPVFKPPPLMGGPTRQSVLGAMVKKSECRMRRERVELSDGDFVDIDYMDTKVCDCERAAGAPGHAHM